MKKIKNIIIAVIVVMAVACIAYLGITYLGSSRWIERYDKELDQFFGAGRWEFVSEETKESIIFEEYYSSRNYPNSTTTPGEFKNWYISTVNEDGEEEMWMITNHVLKINHDEYSFLSPKRLSNKQAFVLELFDIACIDAGEDVRKNILGKVMSEEAADCFRVEISYKGGNPEPEFYDELWEETWFNADELSAGKFLSSELYDFYIDIHLHDYKLEELSVKEQKEVLDSFEEIEKMLLSEYGKNASFDMYFDEKHSVEYEDGQLAE